MKRTAKEMESLAIAGLKEAVAIQHGEIAPARVRTRTTTARHAEVAPPPVFDAKRVVALRTALEVSQPVFAKVLNVSPKLVQAWEQGARMPNGASQRLLQVAEHRGSYLVKDLARLQRSVSSAHLTQRSPASLREGVSDHADVKRARPSSKKPR